MSFQSVEIGSASKMVLLNSRSLYSQPKMGVIRELYANAMDSGRESGYVDKDGEPLPAYIGLPTRDDPTLVIRDYGAGCTDAVLVKYVLGMFNSSKEDDDKSIGKFGLGSVTPITISDSYVVKSYVVEDGVNMLHVRKAYIETSDDGEMTFGNELISSGPWIDDGSQFRTGLKFEIPADPDHDWVDELSCLEYLTHPIGNFVTEDVFPAREILLGKDDWRIYEHGPKIVCVMGGIKYRVDHDDIHGINHGSISLVLFFDNKELNVTPSRENLMFNDNGRTLKAIQTKIAKVKRYIENNAGNAVLNTRNYVEALKTYRKFQSLGHRFEIGFRWATLYSVHSYAVKNSFHMASEDERPAYSGYTSDVLGQKHYYLLETERKKIKHIGAKKKKVDVTKSWSRATLLKFNDDKDLRKFRKITGLEPINLADVVLEPHEIPAKSDNSKAPLRNLFDHNSRIDFDDLDPDTHVYVETDRGYYQRGKYDFAREYVEKSKGLDLTVVAVPKTRIKDVDKAKLMEFGEWFKQQPIINFDIVEPVVSSEGVFRWLDRYDWLVKKGFLDSGVWTTDFSPESVVTKSKLCKNPKFTYVRTEVKIDSAAQSVYKQYPLLQTVMERGATYFDKTLSETILDMLSQHDISLDAKRKE